LEVDAAELANVLLVVDDQDASGTHRAQRFARLRLAHSPTSVAAGVRGTGSAPSSGPSTPLSVSTALSAGWSRGVPVDGGRGTAVVVVDVVGVGRVVGVVP